ncbi:MAG: heavy-metal-associated domain-containing protein [Bacteroidales bacterium]|nr:heavy-metal-associated domain-containing protein [Bacteroidales bacterium]
MKTKSMMLIVGLLFIGMTSLFAQKGTTEKITVHGKCGMCKSRIEKAAKSVEGVAKASWDATENVLTVKYDAGTTTVLEIEQAIAKVGHDTKNVRADDKVYDNLHGCCKYERPASKKKEVVKGHEGHKH